MKGGRMMADLPVQMKQSSKSGQKVVKVADDGPSRIGFDHFLTGFDHFLAGFDHFLTGLTTF